MRREESQWKVRGLSGKTENEAKKEEGMGIFPSHVEAQVRDYPRVSFFVEIFREP